MYSYPEKMVYGIFKPKKIVQLVESINRNNFSDVPALSIPFFLPDIIHHKFKGRACGGFWETLCRFDLQVAHHFYKVI